MRRRIQTKGHANPAVQNSQTTSPTVHAGFDTERPTCRTSTAFALRPNDVPSHGAARLIRGQRKAGGTHSPLTGEERRAR